uniref:Uncharacterized protein n=1 Tax=Thermogemmatispora argillosa TaxID=2045280 RepID=A0A455T6H9_9CHLR|nr:hypothetical protein KTA_15330 [Thermogemmatispora argillosa]
MQLQQPNYGLQTGSKPTSSFASDLEGTYQPSKQSRPLLVPKGAQIGPGISFQIPSFEDEEP